MYQHHQYTEQIQKQVAIEQSKYKMDITVSVATVVTDAFWNNWIIMPRKSAKTMRIIVEIEYIRNRGVTFWPKRIRQLFPTLWSSHEFGHKISQILWPLHSMGNSHLILSDQNITPQFITCSIFSWFYPIFLDHNPIFAKSIGHDCGSTNHSWIHIEKQVLNIYNTYIECMLMYYSNRQPIYCN